MKGLELQRLTYRTDDGTVILDPLDLQIRAGEITVIAGCAGSGKSTLLHLLCGMKAPALGGGSQIVYDGSPLWSRGKVQGNVQRRIGFVHQYPEHQFFLPTVREELLYSLKPYLMMPEEKARRIREALDRCGLQEAFLERSPFFLSGGEKRKAALASVLVTEPDWLILDEPSSGLDPMMGEWLAAGLDEWKQRKGVNGGIVVATHDLDGFLPIADRVILLKDGRLFGSWNPWELERSPQLWVEAGIGIPDCMKMAALVGGPAGREADGEGQLHRLSIPVMADRWEWRLRSGSGLSPLPPPDPPRESKEGMLEAYGHPKAPHPLAKLDPRVKWAVYLLFSIAVLAQSVWAVIALSTVLVIAASRYAGLTMAFWRKPLAPMVGFILISFGISGLELSLTLSPFSMGGTRFVWQQGEATLERLAAFIPVMAAGILFAYSTDPTAMKKGLEALLKTIPGFRKAGAAIAWATSVLFRFMKWIPAELERFSGLAAFRGKSGGRPGRIRLLQLPSFFTPLLLSVMQHAEELSLALEARGYRQVGQERTNAAPLRFTRQDGTALGIGAAAVLILVVIGRLLG